MNGCIRQLGCTRAGFCRLAMEPGDTIPTFRFGVCQIYEPVEEGSTRVESSGKGERESPVPEGLGDKTALLRTLQEAVEDPKSSQFRAQKSPRNGRGRNKKRGG